MQQFCCDFFFFTKSLSVWSHCLLALISTRISLVGFKSLMKRIRKIITTTTVRKYTNNNNSKHKNNNNNFLLSKLFILKRINFHALFPFVHFSFLSYPLKIPNSFLITFKRERKYNNRLREG